MYIIFRKSVGTLSGLTRGKLTDVGRIRIWDFDFSWLRLCLFDHLSIFWLHIISPLPILGASATIKHKSPFGLQIRLYWSFLSPWPQMFNWLPCKYSKILMFVTQLLLFYFVFIFYIDGTKQLKQKERESRTPQWQKTWHASFSLTDSALHQW